MMNMGITMVVILPTKFFSLIDTMVQVLDNMIERMAKLSYINYAKEQIMEPVVEVAFTGCQIKLQ